MSQEIQKYQPPAAPMVPYAEMERMASTIAQSGWFGVKSPVQALALMLIAQAEGLHPATAARDYHVIQGRPSLKADTMLARFQAAGGKVEWHDYTDTVVSGTFSHPAGGKVKVEWTLEMAKRAKLTGKDVWTQYPRAMLRARVVSEGIRTVYPSVLSGMYTPEEVLDIADIQGEAETTGPAPPPPPPPESVARDYDGEIRAFKDKAKMSQWFVELAKKSKWTKTTPVYMSLKAACIERAAAIDAEAKQPEQTADEFDACLGSVEDLGEAK